MSTQDKKKRILAWSDSPTVKSGLGKITFHVLQELSQNLGYEIEQIAVNHFGTFFDQDLIPWQIQAATSKDPKDRMGKKLFLSSLEERDYDLVWIHLDVQHLGSISEQIKEVKNKKKAANASFPKIVFYAPIDMPLHPHHRRCFEHVDAIVSESQFGRDEILRIAPDLEGKLSVIGVGHDPKLSFTVTEETRKIYRKSYFRIADEDTFLIINVNRNTLRKQISQSLSVFAEFKKGVPNSKLYLHTETSGREFDVDIPNAMKELGLRAEADVVLPENYSLDNPTPEETLAAIYSSADCFLTTSFGEGWGITHTDAMARGLPVVAPANTVFTEQLDAGARGYLYPCREKIWFKDIGFRPIGRVEDACEALTAAYSDFCTHKRGTNPRALAAKEWAKDYSWDKVLEQWKQLFKSL